MNKVRANFTACCGYPALVISDDVIVECSSVCSEEPEASNEGTTGRPNYNEYELAEMPDCSCTTTKCAFMSMEILIPTYGENGQFFGYDINYKGVISSFLLSVGFDESWGPVLNEVVLRCYDQFSASDGGFECNSMPVELFDIIECSYKQNFLKCPSWNPQGILECQYTYEYVTKCMDDTSR